MPELPEVEGMRQRLKPLVVGRRIETVEDISGSVTRSFAGVGFAEGVRGRTFIDTGRRAKNLLLTLDDGNTLVMHFMRNGMLEYTNTETTRTPHTWAILSLDDGKDLRLRDTMRVARWSLCSGQDFSGVSTMNGLGPEYTDPEFTVEYLAGCLKRRSPLKSILVDQSVVTGIGNGYSHEVAWEAGLRPDRAGLSLSNFEVERLYKAIAIVFERGIASRLASPLNIMGDEGWANVLIHRKKDVPCPKCGEPITGEKLGGGLAYYCRRCQR